MKPPVNVFREVQGTAIVEASIAMGFIVLFFSAASMVVGISGAYFWIDHVLYETLICLAEGGSESSCRAQAVAKIETTVPFCSLDAILLGGIPGKYQGTIRFSIPRLLDHETFTVQKKIRLDQLRHGSFARDWGKD